MANKLNPICKEYRTKKLGTKTANGSIITKITFDSESRQNRKEEKK